MTGQFAPSRHVALQGAVNVRDIGGYRTVYGTTVLRRQLFRGDALCQLTGDDMAVLASLGLRTVIDLRTPGELLVNGPDRLPPGLTVTSMPVAGGDMGWLYELIASGDHARQFLALGDGRGAARMAHIYRGFVADPRQREVFGAALRLMCQPGRVPALFHCSGGKDRAGWLAAIVLTILGVPRQQVTRDYLLSNDFHRTGYQRVRYDLVKTGLIADPELLRAVLELSPAYLDVAFDEAERRYGSFGAFVTRGLGTGEAALAALRQAVLSGFG